MTAVGTIGLGAITPSAAFCRFLWIRPFNFTLIDISAWDVTSENNKSVPVLVDQDLTTCIDAGRHRTDILSTYTGWQTRGTHNFTIVSCTDKL